MRTPLNHFVPEYELGKILVSRKARQLLPSGAGHSHAKLIETRMQELKQENEGLREELAGRTQEAGLRALSLVERAALSTLLFTVTRFLQEMQAWPWSDPTGVYHHWF